MGFLVLGFLTGLIGSIPFDFGREGWIKKWAILTAVFTAINTFIAYLAMPQLIGPLWGFGIWWMVMWGLVVNVVWCWYGTYNGPSYRIRDNYIPGYRNGAAATALVLVGLLPVIGGMRGCGAWHADSYRAIVAGDVEEREWKADIQPVDTAHIRMVSELTATWMAKKAFGQAEGTLGSRFQVGQPTIQKVKNELVWVIPLEFQGFKAWTAADVTPGYIIVSAEDPTREPKLVTGHKFRYVPSAYMSDDLERHLYTHGFMTQGVTDYTFEIDDEGNPFYVVTVYEPTLGYWGELITSVAVVNPETGEITTYAPDKAPEWIDRIIPMEFAHERLTDYGRYAKGWWNAAWDQEGVNKPTDPEKIGDLDPEPLWLVWGDDGKAYWFTGLTSAKSSDDSLVGFVLMDTRTGHTREYRLSGADESGVMKAVNTAVSNFKGWYATEPVLYNVYGELTWVVPVVSDAGSFQRLALVQASNAQVTLGENKNQALAKYRLALNTKGNTDAPTADSSTRELTGKVARFSCPVLDGNSQCSFTVMGDAHIFTASPSLSPELVLTQLGDTVTVSYTETTESTVPLQTFDLVGLEPPMSKKQTGEKDPL